MDFQEVQKVLQERGPFFKMSLSLSSFLQDVSKFLQDVKITYVDILQGKEQVLQNVSLKDLASL